jgi:hypothetical protein
MRKYPREKEAVKRLEALINAASDPSRDNKPSGEYTFEHLYEKIRPSSPEVLAAMLADLEMQGLIRRIIRVESRTRGGGIHDYSSLLEVPPTVRDWRADEDMTVTPQDLRVLFTLRAA